MADENTTNYSFTKPEVGASEDSWGDKLNANWDSVDSLLSGNTDLSSLSISGDLTVDTDTLYVDSANNRVGIGTNNPASIAHINGDDAVLIIQDSDATNFTTNQSQLHFKTSTNVVGLLGYESDSDEHLSIKANGGSSAIKMFAGNSERMRIDSSGNVGIGTSSPSGKFEVNTGSNIAYFTRTAGDTGVVNTALGFAATSSSTRIGSSGDLQFMVGSVGTAAIAQSEAMRIDSSGNLLVGKTSDSLGVPGAAFLSNGQVNFTRDGNTVHYYNRQTSDGAIVEFRQDNANEGSISVSGTTVSYNGGHLSRWSRLPEGTDDTHIYKGTVMTNLDEMCEWRDEQGDLEDNEQLNKTTVSTQEGDPNVAGLFVAWDEDDDWGDYYLAMTGDLVIRIAQGVTVQRGDLLMSAGDGTAKPQGDDIVRSKTVAKVTSTNISHTYPDGSYAVPCVVMAC